MTKPHETDEELAPEGSSSLTPRPPHRPVPHIAVALGVGVLALVALLAFFGLQPLLQRAQAPAPTRPVPAEGEQTPQLGATLRPRDGTPAPVQSGTIGEPITYQGLYGRGAVTLISANWSDHGDLPPSNGHKYLNLQFSMHTIDGTVIFRPILVTGYDAQKREYLPGIGSGALPQLGDQEIRAGQTVTGWLSLDLPPGQTTVVVSDEGVNPLVVYQVPAG